MRRKLSPSGLALRTRLLAHISEEVQGLPFIWLIFGDLKQHAGLFAFEQSLDVSSGDYCLLLLDCQELAGLLNLTEHARYFFACFREGILIAGLTLVDEP